MSLIKIHENLGKEHKIVTDKMGGHSYLPLYETILSHLKEKAKNVFEIGVCTGSSIKLWHDYFPNATIYGLDIKDSLLESYELKSNNRVKLNINCNAYSDNFIKNFISKMDNDNVKFDMMLDDGPHTAQSMYIFLERYLPLLSDEGIFMIEDIKSIRIALELKKRTPDNLKKFVHIYDLNESTNKRNGRKFHNDNIVFTINRNIPESEEDVHII